MTVQQFIDYLGGNSHLLLSFYAVIFIVILIGLLFIKEDNFNPPITYVYGALVYLVVLPGMFALMLNLYSLFFINGNLLNANLYVYALPLIAMIVALVLINKTVSFKQIPGFDRLSGLMIIAAIAFAIIFFLHRVFFGVFFFAKFQYLIYIFIILFVLLRIGWKRMVK